MTSILAIVTMNKVDKMYQQGHNKIEDHFDMYIFLLIEYYISNIVLNS